ncbi:MAG: sulfotransferase [Chitinophagales bacterium]|nr:sulfotransferase [Chitinophagales bacterium]MDW8418877.1 sulfotransferase [Chitinophagales bacterium]
MQYFSASFYHIRWRNLLRIVACTYRYFTFRVWLYGWLFITLFVLHHVLSLFFRLMDEVFHRGYKKVKLHKPVFIIACPRSGTTFLHRLLALDEERFAYTKNAHTFFMTSSFVQFYELARWIDRRILRGTIRNIINKLDGMFWGGWDDIHPMGFNKAEEDELVFAQQLCSPGIYLPFPFFHLNGASRFLDDEPKEFRQKVMDFYESCLQRFMYRAGKDKTYLAKNVMSTARMRSLLEKFPDAQIICIVRHPYQAVPSMVNMFTLMYDKNNKQAAACTREWTSYAIRFFRYHNTMRKQIAPSQFYLLRYDDLIRNPADAVLSIYRHFGWSISEPYQKRLAEACSGADKYRSAHQYSLRDMGYTEESLYEELSDVMSELGFGMRGG